MEYVIWTLVYIGWAIFLIWIIRAFVKNFFMVIFTKRKTVKAVLVSKVEEEYYEVKTHARVSGAGIKRPDDGLRYGNKGIAYRLYFNVNNKKVQLDVDKQTWERMPKEGCSGMLDYKANIFYDFIPDSN